MISDERNSPSCHCGALLEVANVSISFGGIRALSDVSFTIGQGQVCALIGPNGAGKSTLFNCLSRLYTPNSGLILFNGIDVLKLPASGISKVGIGRTFQNLALFGSMSVKENILVGCHSNLSTGVLLDMLGSARAKRAEGQAQALAYELMDLVDLRTVADVPVSQLPFGTQKRVELARALASKPKLLLLDEPACGLNHSEIGELAQLVRKVRDELGVTTLLVEHHMGLVMGVSDHVVALNFGKKIAEGTPREVSVHPEVVRAYLGEDSEQASTTEARRAEPGPSEA